MSFRAAYTLGKSMDDTSAFLATDGDDNTPQDSRNLAAEWGPSDFDVRQRLVLTAQWTGPRSSGLAASRATGRPAPSSPRSRAAPSRRGSASTTATRATSAAAPSPTIARISSRARPPAGATLVSYRGQTFAIAPRYTFGNAGRDSLVGPGYAALDAMVSRNLSLGDRRAADAAAGDLQRPEPDELSAPRQLRRSRDVRPVARDVPAAPAPARRAISLFSEARCARREVRVPPSLDFCSFRL